MTQFYQQGQQVKSQYNAGRDMSFGNVSTPEDLVSALDQLGTQLDQAKQTGVLNEEVATDAQYQVTKVAQQAKKSDPDKKQMVDHLSTAKTIVDGATAAGGLVTAISVAIEAVQKLF